MKFSGGLREELQPVVLQETLHCALAVAKGENCLEEVTITLRRANFHDEFVIRTSLVRRSRQENEQEHVEAEEDHSHPYRCRDKPTHFPSPRSYSNSPLDSSRQQ